MKIKRNLLICIIIVSLGVGFIQTIQIPKIAVLLHDSNPSSLHPLDRIEQTADIADILRFHGYKVYIITDRDEFRTFQANRIIFVYYGHGSHAEHPVITLKGEAYDFRELMQMLRARELILAVECCRSGVWTNLANRGRLIITNANRTITYVLRNFPPFSNRSGALYNLFWYAHHRGLSLEESYKVWLSELMLPWYNYLSLNNCTMSPPIICDGIYGDVWL